MSKANIIKKMPHASGCYLFKDEKGEIIYVGKAKDLHKRASSYFKEVHQYEKTRELVKHIYEADYIITNNEIEALLLEARLIKERQPKYNISLKDDKSYAYIKVTQEEFSRFVTARTADIKKGDTVYGPYVSGEARREFLRLINRMFKLRVCKKLPKRACLLYHIGQCSAPCIEKISKLEYLQNVKKAEMLLRGDNKELIVILGEEMRRYSGSEEYELAKSRRDQISALTYLAQKEVVHLRKQYNQDVINYIIDNGAMLIQIFNIHKGVISNRKDFMLEEKDILKKTDEIFSQFLSQYYYSSDIPQEIIIPKKIADKKIFEGFLEKLAGHKVVITIPNKGDKKKLLDLLRQNIISKNELGDMGLHTLKEALNLPAYPRVIECFDISNLGNTFLVASMVRFREGKPDKSNYRRFKIKSVQGQSDFDSMKEAVYRRYYRLKMEGSEMPNLIVIDGGKPQLTAALASLNELGLSIPLIALAKKEEEIYMTDQMHPLKLLKNNPALHVLQRIRNEAHRFANKYHRLLRSKKFSTQ